MARQDEVIAALERRIAQLEAIVLKQANRIAELEHRIRRNSSNSNQPPSSDPPGSPPPASPPPRSGRSPGGQPGHPPHVRQEFRPQEIDSKITVRPKQCRSCSRRLAESLKGVLWDHRQVVEFPPMSAEVHQFERHGVNCPGCGTFNIPDWPTEGAGFVGPRLQAFLSILVGRFRLSRREAEELLQEALGPKAKICLGSVKNLEARTAAALEAPYEEALEAVRGEPVVHVDETGWYERTKLVWLWTLTTRSLAVYRIDPRRGKQAFRDFAGSFSKVLVSDRWKAYLDWGLHRHQLCWAHAKRDFRKWEDRGGWSRRIGREALECEGRVFELWKRRREGKLSRGAMVSGMKTVRRRLRRILKRGTRVKALKAVCEGFLVHEPALWTFLGKRGVDLTNNLAERAIRPAVMWRKTSFGSWSTTGARFVERMLTVAATLRRQGRSVLEYLARAVRAHRAGRHAPRLVMASTC
ncbi:MAG: IS66 family transposase [Bryobacteraceae bacterium]